MRNQFTFLGRLVKIPEEHEKVTHFTIAVDDYKAKDENGKPTADFMRITCFGKTKEIAEKYLTTPGMSILVTGKVKPNIYVKEGVTMYGCNLIATEIEFG